MNSLYVTCNYETVQSHLFNTFNEHGQSFDCFYYSLREITKEVTQDNVYCYSLNSKIRGPILYVSRLKAIARAIRRLPNVEKYNILHANMAFRDGIICRYIYKRLHIPYVISVRMTDFEEWHKPGWSLYRMEYLKALRDAKSIIFLSQTYKERLMEIVPLRDKTILHNKSFIVPNGIDDYFLNNKNIPRRIGEDKEIRIIAVGLLDSRKNLEATVMAVGLLRDQGRNVVIRAVGEIREEKYRELIRRTEYLEYYQKCPKEEILGHLRSSDIFVLPSKEETFGLVYAEAMSQGLPVIYTKKEGFDGQFIDGLVGYAVEPNNPEAIANAIKKTIANYEMLSINCINMVDKFNWHTIANQLVEIYNR